MTITPHLFEAYLKCPTKCFLRAHGEAGTGNEYADWVRTQNADYEREAIQFLQQGTKGNECVSGTLTLVKPKSANWRLGQDLTVRADGLQSTIHAVERMPPQGRGNPARFIPIRFITTNKLTRDDKLLLAFDALAFAESTGHRVDAGKIIHGDDHTACTVKTAALTNSKRRKRLMQP